MTNKRKDLSSFNNYCKALREIALKIKVHSPRAGAVDFEAALNDVVEEITATKKRQGQVIIVGNGGSASMASHMAVDLWKNGGVRAISFNDASLLTCISNDFGYAHVFEKPVEMFAESLDLLIAISSSGKSENIIRAVEAAKKKKCRVVTLSGFKADNSLHMLGDVNFYVPA
jgi:D-sedoheptulose 7-phosphate isomerase